MQTTLLKDRAFGKSKDWKCGKTFCCNRPDRGNGNWVMPVSPLVNHSFQSFFWDNHQQWWNLGNESYILRPAEEGTRHRIQGRSSSRLFVFPVIDGWDLGSSLQNISTRQWYLVSFPHPLKYMPVIFKFFPVSVLKPVLCAAICDFILNVGTQKIRLCNSHSLENKAWKMFDDGLRTKKKSSQQH